MNAEDSDKDEPQLLDDARNALLKEINRVANDRADNGSKCRQLAEAYAWLVAPSNPHGSRQ